MLVVPISNCSRAQRLAVSCTGYIASCSQEGAICVWRPRKASEAAKTEAELKTDARAEAGVRAEAERLRQAAVPEDDVAIAAKLAEVMSAEVDTDPETDPEDM